MTMKRAVVAICTVFLLAALAQVPAQVANVDLPPRSVFEQPILAAQNARLQQTVVALMRAGKHVDAEKLLKQAIEKLPNAPLNYYNLACAQAMQGRSAEAMNSLRTAIEKGFNNESQIRSDTDLISLRELDGFADLLQQAKGAQPLSIADKVKPQAPVDGQVVVTEQNTIWDARLGVFRSFFQAAPPDNGPVLLGSGKAQELVRTWYEAGTAAGNAGDFYDNHDGDHSNLTTKNYPQLTRIEFSAEARKRRHNSGLQDKFLYNVVTLGNSSTAVMGPFWRSQTRLAYTRPRGPFLLYLHYRSNHLYVYPEHRDYDPGHNKKDGGGYGDVYCANTPYLVTSQGSSGSDRRFLDAIACTMAAFRPETKQRLVQQGALMPTVQMILRRCYQPVITDKDYLRGAAHPVVFEGKRLNAAAMVTLAHDIRPDNIPPLAMIQVLEEDEPVVGVDYFDAGPREKLFDTPAAVARIMRSTAFRRRLVVSAAPSKDINDRKLTYHWSVLLGKTEDIQITPLNDSGSKVELSIPFHERRPIRPDSKMETNRVDIGLFVNNGVYFSAPAFLSFYFLDNEKRTYNENEQIARVEYSSPDKGGNYTDPTIDTPKDWIDQYEYDDRQRLIGWTRHRGDNSVEHFTTNGELVTKWDEQGRPIEARSVKYMADRQNGQTSRLIQVPGDDTVRYEYSSDLDRIGRVVDDQ
jgi:hypothetical protein